MWWHQKKYKCTHISLIHFEQCHGQIVLAAVVEKVEGGGVERSAAVEYAKSHVRKEKILKLS